VTSQDFAASLVANLVASGVESFYLSPGARSQALAIAAEQLASAGRAKLTVRLDERSMAFTALGNSSASGKPVAVITTSGTAVANLHPAVLEAFHAGIPLILLTADRPARLRGKGANQTTLQQGIFASATVAEFDLEADDPAVAAKFARSAVQAAVNKQGPVQLNLQFDLPLSSSSPTATEVLANLDPLPPVTSGDVAELEVPVDDHTVVIAGAGGEGAREFAEKAGLPLLAEPSSGERRGPNAIVDYIAALEDLRDQVRKVVVFGKPTLSRPIQKLISASSVYVNRSRFGLFDPFDNVIASADRLLPASVAGSEWLASWRREPEIDARAELVQFVWDKSDRLLFGASDLIRVADRVVKPKDLEVYSNRGLSGIDGTVSTAIGIAQQKGEVTAQVGDLTLLHDAGGLNVSDLGHLNVRLIVGNDSGGHIFTRLEVHDQLPSSSFERLFATPQEVDFSALAAAYGWKYFRCESLEQLAAAWGETGYVLIDFAL
jgi:2-succinyl-5-enolpyruvyl-6-hydroxy-3-cyclohexene-1-carboxylate synthase